MPHLSSGGSRLFSLVNGGTSANPYVAAMLCVGDSGPSGEGEGEGGGTLPQFSLCAGNDQTAHGRLTWDADHARNGSESPFFTVAPVRLEVKASGECRLAVGTGDFVTLRARPYRWIERVQIAAAVAKAVTPARAVRWDLIDLVLSFDDGRAERFESACLPSVAGGGSVRRAAGASSAVTPSTPAGQYAELLIGSRDVVGLKLRGQVTLRANDDRELPRGVALGPLDLLGQVAVFTDTEARG